MREKHSIEVACPSGHPDLKCGLDRIEVQDEIRMVDLHVPAGHSTDMTGAIRLAVSVLGDVELVQVWSGRERDIRYRLVDGKWKAKCLR